MKIGRYLFARHALASFHRLQRREGVAWEAVLAFGAFALGTTATSVLRPSLWSDCASALW
jgi:hypothetical protein